MKSVSETFLLVNKSAKMGILKEEYSYTYNTLFRRGNLTGLTDLLAGKRCGKHWCGVGVVGSNAVVQSCMPVISFAGHDLDRANDSGESSKTSFDSCWIGIMT
jgi:hypothetical protein